MNTRCTLASLLAAVLLSGAVLPSFADPIQDELQRLRDENAELRRQLEQLRPQTPSTTAATPRSEAAPASAPITPAPATSAAPAAPAGYKLVKEEPEAPYSRTGCRRYKNAVDTRWKQRDNWEGLARGQTMSEVEELLGIEHHDIRDDRRIGWQYGKCEASVRGTVVFEAGQVLYWEQPTF